MKLLSSTQISWNEPWCFVIRIREGWGWRRRLLLALAISAVMFLVVYFFQAGQRGLPAMIAISLLAGFVLVALLDVGNLQREVTVKDDCILVNSAVSNWWFETFKLDAVQSVQLIRPGEWDKRYGGMVIQTAGDGFLVAVPNKVSLKTLADVLHRLKVAVTLSDWEPSPTDTRIGVRDEIELDPQAARGEIEVRPVEEAEGPLLAPGHVAVQLVIALGPLLLALIGAIVVGVVLVRNWANLSVLERSLYGGGAFVALVVAFLYLVAIGQFVAAAYGIRVGRSRLRTRPNAMFDGTDDDLLGVEIFDRENWTKTVSKSLDYGFLRIDRPQSRLLFEGNKSRWTLPLSALTACRIEESIVGSEGNQNPEKRYYVVIGAAGDGKAWEAGMISTRTELGNDTAESRYKRAQLLFAQLADVV
jgi:hypothetical protein